MSELENTDLQAVYLYHLLQAEQIRREFVRAHGREPENPYRVEGRGAVGSLAERLQAARERVKRNEAHTRTAQQAA